MNFLNKTLEYIFLPSCGICKKLGEGYLCTKCEKKLKKYEFNLMQNLTKHKNEKSYTSDENDELIERYHIFRYEGIIRELILKYKFDEEAYLYKTFCKFIVKNKKIFDFIESYDIIIPVPIHKKRMKERGYNQSELIAQELSKMANIKCYKDILIKIRNNKPQSTLNGKMRKENAKNVYKLEKIEKITNKRILLFDDIYTTGATVNSCIQELKKVKVKQIGILTLAKD